jgi:hypothetical protein
LWHSVAPTLQAVRKVTCAVLKQMHIEQNKTIACRRNEAAFALTQCKHKNYIHQTAQSPSKQELWAHAEIFKAMHMNPPSCL